MLVKPRTARSSGFTLIELLIVLGLLAWLIFLIPVGVQKVRESELRTRSLNNLKRISGATLNLATNYKQKLPPGVGDFSGRTGTVFLFLLPYLEQEGAFRQAMLGGNAAANVIPVFTSPPDPSMPANLTVKIAGQSYGATSYAANGFVFAGDYPGRTAFATYYLKDGAVNANAIAGQGSHPIKPIPATRPVANIRRTFSDGTSNTILFMERYAVCPMTDGDAKKPGAHAWGYTAGGYDAQHAPIQMNLRLPQWAPPLAQADCVLPQSLVQGPICVSMADGSTREVTSKIQPVTWAKVLLPNDGSQLPKGWDQE
jgi:prepilin-type N-terminal cleavage/methylation domain-containing protein